MPSMHWARVPRLPAGPPTCLPQVAGSLKMDYGTASLFISGQQAYLRLHNLTHSLHPYGQLVKTNFIVRGLLRQPLQHISTRFTFISL